jgi:hypothetical protein
MITKKEQKEILKIINGQIKETKKVLKHFKITADEIINRKNKFAYFDFDEQCNLSVDAGYLWQATKIKEDILKYFTEDIQK